MGTVDLVVAWSNHMEISKFLIDILVYFNCIDLMSMKTYTRFLLCKNIVQIELLIQTLDIHDAKLQQGQNNLIHRLAYIRKNKFLGFWIRKIYLYGQKWNVLPLFQVRNVDRLEKNYCNARIYVSNIAEIRYKIFWIELKWWFISCD